MWHKGEDAWLNFRGKWGNKGEYDCWWHSMIGICQVSSTTESITKHELIRAAGRCAAGTESVVRRTTRCELVPNFGELGLIAWM